MNLIELLTMYQRRCQEGSDKLTMYSIDDKVEVKAHFCRKTTCDDCYGVRVIRQGIALETALNELPQHTVWFGELTQDLRKRAKKTLDFWNGKRKDNPYQWIQTIYFHSDTVGVISTVNLLRKVKDALVEMSKNEAVLRWVQLGLDYKPRRNYSDWDIKPLPRATWLLTGEIEQVVETMRRACVKPGDEIDNDLDMSARLNRYLFGIRNGESDGTNDDLYS